MRSAQIRLLLLIALLSALTAAGARAQSCSADSQCPGGGMTRTICVGNTAVTQRSVCAGSCQTVEVARVPCGGACSGGVCIDLGSRDATPRGPAIDLPRPLEPCRRSCTCRNGRLLVETGLRDADGRCTTRARRCPGGCSCEPSPRCIP